MLVKVTEMCADAFGNTRPGQTYYCDATSVADVEEYIDRFVPQGLRSWHIEQVLSFPLQDLPAAVRKADKKARGY